MRTCLGTIAAALLASLFASGAAGAAQQSRELRARLAELLCEGGPRGEDLALELAALGEGAVPDLFVVLERRRFPPEWLERKGEEKPPAVPEVGPPRLAAALLALERLPRAALRRHVRAELVGSPSLATRETALQALAVCGTAQDLDLCASAAAPAGAALAPRSLRQGFAAALRSIAERDPAARRELAALFWAVPASLRPAIVDEIGRGEGGLASLAELLGADRELDPLLLSAMARAARAAEPPFDERALGAVRQRLGAADPALAQAAAAVAGELETPSLALFLCPLLERPEANLKSEGRRALVRIAGADLGASRAEWERWLLAQELWWEREAPALLESLRAGSAEEAHQALLALAPRRLYRRAVAEGILGALERPEPELVRAACGVLGQLDQRGAAAALQRYLEHPEAGVREAAARGLAALAAARAGGRP